MKRLLTVAGIFLLLAACSPKTMIVLVPDDDEMVGQIKISTPKEEVVLNQPNQFIQARERAGAIKEMDESKIQKIFGDALAALPPRPDILIEVFTFQDDQDPLP